MERHEVAGMLRHSHTMENAGISAVERRRLVAAKEIVPLRGGWYAHAADWAHLFGEDRHLARVLATAARMRSDGAAFSHESAAALWGLPLYRRNPVTVHTTLRRERHVRSADGVSRHRDRLPEVDVVEVGGVRATSLARTVIDVARTTACETALAATDAAFRLVAWDDAGHAYDGDSAESFREQIVQRISAMTGRRGIRQARFVTEIADGRAQLPGESVSRLRLLELGFAAPRLQVEVAGVAGKRYFIDFGLDDVAAWGEFDGHGKYVNPAILGSRTTADVVREEKQREDWIRATTGRPVARWSFEHIGSPLALARQLHLHGIHAPR